MARRRNKQARKHRSGEIPTGSFSDIAFLLIIYFLVATTLVKVKTITADLPTGEKQATNQATDTLTLNLRGEDMFFNDNLVTREQLNARLAALDLQDKDPDKRVVMLESANTTYTTYFHALAAISRNGGVIALVEEDE